MDVWSEPIDTERVDVVDVFGTEITLAEGFDDVASGREGSVDFGFGVVDDGTEPGCARPAGGGLGGSEGWSRDDDLEEPSA